MTEVPVEGPPEEFHLDESIRIRRMGRKALLLEAKSEKYLAAHTPHNPLCEVCVRAHMRHRQYAKTREPDDKQLENVSEPLKQLGTDTMIIAKAAADGS